MSYQSQITDDDEKTSDSPATGEEPTVKMNIRLISRGGTALEKPIGEGKYHL